MRRNCSMFSISVLLLTSVIQGSDVRDARQTRSDFETLANELPYLSTGAVLYDRPDSRLHVADAAIREKNARIIERGTDGKDAQAALLDLLSHREPKVRTLAAVALFDREDPAVLPALVKLHADESPTFMDYPRVAVALGMERDAGPPTVKQTVGNFATKMVELYLQQSGFYYGVEHPTQPDFEDYWSARKNRSHCAGWYAVKLARASRSTTPTPEDCVQRIQALREQIDKLPHEERTWVLLRLYGEAGSDALVSEDELIEACRKVGAEKLMLMLENKIPSDDPDLQSRRSGNWPYRRMVLFVLRHGNELLRHADSEALLACESWQRDYARNNISDPTITAWWAVAAARLQPQRATPILHEAMKRFRGKYDADERSTLCVALWQLCGKKEANFIVDWFYTESPEVGSFPNYRGSFIQAVGGDPSGKAILAKIIDDPRLAELDWQSLERLVRVVNTWTDTPVVSESRLQEAWHPTGQVHYHWERAEAIEKYPQETAELERNLDGWRTQLRKSVPDWYKGMAPVK